MIGYILRTVGLCSYSVLVYAILRENGFSRIEGHLLSLPFDILVYVLIAKFYPWKDWSLNCTSKPCADCKAKMRRLSKLIDKYRGK